MPDSPEVLPGEDGRCLVRTGGNGAAQRWASFWVGERCCPSDGISIFSRLRAWPLLFQSVCGGEVDSAGGGRSRELSAWGFSSSGGLQGQSYQKEQTFPELCPQVRSRLRVGGRLAFQGGGQARVTRDVDLGL